MNEIYSHIDQISKICALNGVKTLFAFGSVTTDKFHDKSDIDLIVDIEESDPISYSDNYFNLKTQLEKLLKRHIDLLESRALKNSYLRDTINKTKVLVYGA